MHRVVRRYLPVALALGFVGVAVGRLSAAAPCVSPGGAHGCSASINAAIAAAAPGDTIRIDAGRYVENVVIDKSVTLAGRNEGDDVVIMPAISSANPCEGSSLCGGAASNIILVRANNVTIRDLTLDGDNPALTSGIVRDGADLDARNGIITDHSAGVWSNLSVLNVTIRNIYLRGVYASSGGSFLFKGNTVTNVQGDGYSIAMFNFGGSGAFIKNRVTKAADAIASNWSTGVQFLNNTVRKSASGIHTDNTGAADVISGNHVSDGTDGSWGIWVFVPYVGVTVKDNDVSGMDVGLAGFSGALMAPNAAVVTTFINNDVRGRRTAGSVGVFLTTDTLGYGQSDAAATLTGNTVQDFETGVVIQTATGQSMNVAASCNAITGSTKQSVIAGGLAADAFHLGEPTPGGGFQSIAFSTNTIDGKKIGIENRAGSSIMATDNYWGCSAGPNAKGCNTTVGPVISTPWLKRPAACVAQGERHERDERDDRN
jgi:hypothetical protein